MPLTTFQKSILLLLRQHRNPNSYVAGGIAIHRAPSSSRYSNDIDFFHDNDEAVTISANADLKLLQERGFQVEPLINQPSFVRVVIKSKQEALKLEWVRDTAFRFFPVIEDDELGYRLHDVDLAINKCLALANRNEVRDIIDILHAEQHTMSFYAACWAACGKDPGFTPELIIDCIRKNSIIRPEHLEAEYLTQPRTPSALKQQWLEVLNSARQVLDKLPATDLGGLYLDNKGLVVHTPNPNNLNLYHLHFGSVGGSWPRLVR